MMTQKQIDQKTKSIKEQAAAMQSWATSLTDYINEHPEEFKDLQKTEDQEVQELQEKSFMNCGASKNQCEKAGFDKFINYNNNPRQEALKKTAFSFFGDIANDVPKILVLHGNPGTGKTYTALSILKMFFFVEKPMRTIQKWVRDMDKCVEQSCKNMWMCHHPQGCECGHYEEEPIGIREFKSGNYIKSDDLCEKVLGKVKFLSPQQAKKFYSTTELLVVDEIGRPTGFNSRSESEVLFKILDERKENELPTILCSNLNYQELQELMGKALFSRIAENGVFFDTSDITDMRSKAVKDYMAQRRFYE